MGVRTRAPNRKNRAEATLLWVGRKNPAFGILPLSPLLKDHRLRNRAICSIVSIWLIFVRSSWFAYFQSEPTRPTISGRNMPDHTLFGILGIGRVLLNLWMPPSVRFVAPLATISEECTISPAVAFLAKGGLLACSQNPKNRRVFLKSIWDLKKGYQTTRKLFSDQKKKTFSIKSGVGVCLL